MTAAVFALILAAEVDPNALLERVAARYAELKTFSLEVRQNEHFAVAVPRGTSNIRLDVGAGNRYYFRESRDLNPGDSYPTLTIVNDGENIWRKDGKSAKAVSEEVGLSADRRVRDAIHLLHRRFTMLDGRAMRARYVKTEKVRGRPCAVIQIESRVPEAPAMWDETLWIDPESAAILRSHFTRVSNTDGSKEVLYREYLVPPGQRPPDESLFDITPDARRRR